MVRSSPDIVRSPPTTTLPVVVKFLKPVISLFESTITAKEAETVPAVIPSTKFNSAAVDVIAVPPIASLLATTLNVALSSILATSVPSLC